MSAYLARLKQLEGAKDFHRIPDSEPSKPSKVPFEPFEGARAGHIEKKLIDMPKSESVLDRQQNLRRQKVLAMLVAAPETERAVYCDIESDTRYVILTLAVRSCQQTCEMLISKREFDPWKLLALIEQHGKATQ